MDNQHAFDAVILAGGRSSRLDGTPKQSLVYDGGTLLERALQAAAGASRRAVVGPDPGMLPPGVLCCREDPPFAGPAAAIGAGLAALADDPALAPAAFTLVLACDMPRAEAAVVCLLAELAAPAEVPDGVVAATRDGRMQPLAGFYRTAALQNAVDALSAEGALTNASVRSLLASLDLQLVTVPAGSTTDVDTWDDAAALGIAAGPGPQPGTGAAADNLGGSP
ncbi:molybdenum cofactor guanylyltransferase [Pseudarthrobacter sp. NPDC092419]|uniref:molybdenum cofactor guanylyltransferase n=1 Tax=Pseudarthrobacter sp. NPDC092419 TaxID=3364414 RepID=UPI0037FCE64A